MTFDAGALLAFEARDRRMEVLLQRARDLGRTVLIPAGVLAQVWRGAGPRSARLAILLGARNLFVQELNAERAKVVGALCGRSGSRDVIDASVVVAAWTNGRVIVTSDPEDLQRLDPGLTLIRV